MAKIQKRYIDQLTRVWNDLWQEAYNAMSYVDDDNNCDGKFEKVLDKLYDRFDKAMAHIINAE
jgi:hypothetical protein